MRQNIDTYPCIYLEWSEDDIKLITGCIVHAADLSGQTKAWDLAYYFSSQVNQEFIKQVCIGLICIALII